MVKVKILKQVGQTGLRKPGTLMTVEKKTADDWIKFGWAERIVKPRKKKKDVQTTKQDSNGN